MRYSILLLLFVQLIFLVNYSLGSSDGCGTISSITTNTVPISGKIKIFVIFAQFKDDDSASVEWPVNTFPNWANDFVSSNGTGPFAYNNLSQYFNSMSNGVFQVEGDVYNSLITTDENEDVYASIGEVNFEILTRVAADPSVDFSQYDNLDGSSYGHDGRVDLIYIIYRNSTSTLFVPAGNSYTGIAHLELSNTINTDGVSIVSGGTGLSSIGSGVQQREGLNGRDFCVYIAAHEMGHYLFGGGHIIGASNLALMTGGPAWNDSRGMCSWERQHLNWINYSDISTDATVTLTDYMSTGSAYRILISGSGSTEYFLAENRQHVNSHDYAADNGIYIYHVTNANSFPPHITVDCADGNWNFNFNTSTHTIIRTAPNPSGNNELNYSHSYEGKTYSCYVPVYPSDAVWGDNYDAFDNTFNNVFSPVSNPRSTNGAGTILRPCTDYQFQTVYQAVSGDNQRQAF